MSSAKMHRLETSLDGLDLHDLYYLCRYDPSTYEMYVEFFNDVEEDGEHIRKFTHHRLWIYETPAWLLANFIISQGHWKSNATRLNIELLRDFMKWYLQQQRTSLYNLESFVNTLRAS